MVTAKPGRLAAAIDEATAVMRIQRHVPANKPDDFSISTSDSWWSSSTASLPLSRW